MNEFELIKNLFKPLSDKQGLNLEDDAAILNPPSGFELVISKDLIAEGVHFIGNEKPQMIAKKLLGANLSDMAAMGAVPKFYLLGVSVPKNIKTEWLKNFAQGLKEIQEEYGLKLLGGDTTSSKGKMSFSLTIIGYVKKGKALKRCGAKKADDIYVTGTIGDAAIGLDLELKKITDKKNGKFFVEKYQVPRPRVEIGQKILGLANSAIDVSDGLVADLKHICETSNVGAEIELEKIPFSKQSAALLKQNVVKIERLITGGDDYELVFTADPKNRAKIEQISKKTKVKISRIGKVVNSHKTVKVLDNKGTVIKISQSGFRHF